MNQLTLFEIVIVLSMFLQACVLILSLIAFGHIPDKKAWKWFIFAAILVFTRRLTGVFEQLSGMDTHLTENAQTILISAMWIIYILKRTD